MNDLAVPVSKNNNSIEKDDSKCINCGNCLKVCIDEMVSSKILENKKDAEPLCINCGQCASVCPTDAITEKIEYLNVKNLLHNKNGKIITMSIAPAIRVSLSEELDLEPGLNLEKKIPGILKKLGSDYAFDITFGADMTVIEEAIEFVNRLKNNKRIPQFTSCCPAWVKYAEIFYPEYINKLSTVKSPIAIYSSIIKTYFAQKMSINPQNIINVVIAPCTAKKEEIRRKELSVTDRDTDYILTTREFIELIKEENIDINLIEDSNFDSPFSTGSGAGVIFGSSGGVCEAVLRTSYYLYTGKNLPREKLEFNILKTNNNIKEMGIYFDDKLVKVAVCNGIKNIRILIDKLKREEVHYDLIEVMSCEGGCIGGGGQPKNTDEKIKEKRSNTLLSEDKNMKVRLCHENPEIVLLYNKYFNDINKRKMLHTTYEDKSYLLKSD